MEKKSQTHLNNPTAWMNRERRRRKICWRNLKCGCCCHLFFVSFSPTCGCHLLSLSPLLSHYIDISPVIILFFFRSFFLFAAAWAIISSLWLLSIRIQVLPVHLKSSIHRDQSLVVLVTATTTVVVIIIIIDNVFVVVDVISLSHIHMFFFFIS